MAAIGFQHPVSVQGSNASRNKLLNFLQCSEEREIKPVYFELASYIDISSYRNEASVRILAFWILLRVLG
jgi:hypothetical protein